MFFIFGGECFYASGGGFDLLAKIEDEREAFKEAEKLIGMEAVYGNEWDPVITIQWTHIMDGSTGEVIKRFGAFPYGMHRRPVRVQKGQE